jgi:hypothetical protein
MINFASCFSKAHEWGIFPHVVPDSIITLFWGWCRHPRRLPYTLSGVTPSKKGHFQGISRGGPVLSYCIACALLPITSMDIWLHIKPPFHFIFMRVRLLGKSYGINLRCYWERLGELEGNPIWNHIGNQEKIKNPFPLSPLDRSSVHAEPSNWLQKLWFPKPFVTIFGLGTN